MIVSDVVKLPVLSCITNLRVPLSQDLTIAVTPDKPPVTVSPSTKLPEPPVRVKVSTESSPNM